MPDGPGPYGWSRDHWIAHLEQHHSRLLAIHIKDEVDDGNKAIAKGMKVESIWRVVTEGLVKEARDMRMEVETAKVCPEDRLPDVVRYFTLPGWRKIMEEQGFVWNDEMLRWEDER